MDIRNTLSIISLILIFAISADAQSADKEMTVRPVRVETPPRIDGLLDEALWKEIEPITDFRQYEPDNGALPTERTEIRICYDSRYLYFGIRAFDSEPNEIVARTFERDGNVDADDAISIVIDSLGDNRTASVFETNVRGAQLDLQLSEAGDINVSWDAIWYSRGHIDDQGFTIEVAIPFFVLRFQPAEEVRMGLLLERIIRRKNENALWPHLTRDYKVNSVSQYGSMEGLKGIERGVNLEIKPYAVAGYTKTPSDNDYDADAGLDVKWGVTPNFTTDLTLNTDFAQVESDALQINLTRFSLFYPEKRDFFLESADLFQFGLASSAEVFFSRRIGIRGNREVPIIGGARAYGLAGNTNLGLMTMQTDASDGIDGENFSVARVKHNILGKSYLGGIITSRRGLASEEDTTVGGDFMYLVGKNFKVAGSLARSSREGVDEGNWMGILDTSQYTDLYDWTVRYTDIGGNFNPGMGFIQRPDQRGILTNIHFKPRPKIKGIHQLTFGNVYQRIENHDGVLETRRIRPGFLATFKTFDSLMILYDDKYEFVPHSFPIAPDVFIAAGEYTLRQLIVDFSSNYSRKVVLGTGLNTGSFYDGDLFSWYASLIYRPMPRLYLGMDYMYDSVDVPSGSFDSHIANLQFSYYFSPTLTSRVVAQYSSLLEDFVFNFRLRWIYAPGSEGWLVYDEGRRFGTPFSSLKERALICKIVHNFNF
ncbi:MAG TPA: DUF5916 domain-containing protein [Acidobacteriota bacterium]|nr:DUF5916 domain-containing protein [Acidobacteriota bacterium]